MNKHLSIWTVYDHPLDYPSSYVARLFEVESGEVTVTKSIIIHDDLESLRNTLGSEMGLTRLARSDKDDPFIVETWL